MPYVYAFDHKHRKAPMQLKDLLGGKGANLAEMTSVLGLPVPPGFTITTDACRAYMEGGWPDGLSRRGGPPCPPAGEGHGKEVGRPVGPAPRERSVRRQVLHARDDGHGPQPRAQRRVGQGPGRADERRAVRLRLLPPVHLDVRPDRAGHRREPASTSPSRQAKRAAGVESDAEIPAGALRDLCETYKQVVEDATGHPFPQEPADQLRGAIEAVFKSWNGARAVAYRVRERIPHDLGTAVNVQTMVFGNRDDNSGTGVGFTRDPASGRPGRIRRLPGQRPGRGRGRRHPQHPAPVGAAGPFPRIFKELMGIFDRLEAHYRDMCDTEFTIEQGKLWMLQTRVGKRTGRAALRMAVDMTKQRGWKISREEALLRITGEHLDQVLHPQFAETPRQPLGKGLAASPGAAVGRVVLPPTPPAEAAARGERVILVRNETSPEDVHGMIVAQGILTARGGLVSHAAVVARGWGKPAVVGAEAVRISAGGFTVGSTRVAEGDFISIDGTTGEVVLGEVPLKDVDPPEEFDVILGWADKVRKGRLAVRANADNGPDAANARRFGAEGIGLCRTEHMFLAEDRLPIVRRMILAGDDGGGGRRPGGAARRPEAGLRRHPRGHGRPAGHGAPARSAAARVPAVGRGAAHQAGDRGSDAEEEKLLGPPKPGTSSTPCSAPGACASASSSRACTGCRSGP